jgi:ATP-dependent exoDNAse (exonuclease V) beta subunit
VQDALEFLYEACAESRREFSYGEGVTQSTVHSAKGTEFDHVLVIGPWRLPPQRTKQEEERRAFYVGITRARRTLASGRALGFSTSPANVLPVSRRRPRRTGRIDSLRAGDSRVGHGLPEG